VFLVAMGAAITCGVGWLTLANPVGGAWRRDLLELSPLDAPAEKSPTTDPGDDKKKERSKKRRGRTNVPGSGAASPTPAAATPHAGPAVVAPPPAAPAAASPAEAHYEAGLSLMQQKKIPPAIAELEKCIALNPRHALAYRALGMAHSMVGRTESATRAFEKFVALAPDHKDAPKIRATIEAYRRSKK
jgi:tetratricopeptide (TPR) repeat protein